MSIDVAALPPYESISSKPIRDAAAAHDAAQVGRKTAKREVARLERTEAAAKWQDAEAADKALAEGKSAPKPTHAAAHERELEQARHEERVAELTLQRTRNELATALDQHSATWTAEAQKAVESARAEFQELVGKLADAHSRLADASSIASISKGGAGRVGMRMLCFPKASINGIELAPGQSHETGDIYVGNVLAALNELAVPPAPPRERAPQQSVTRALSAEAEVEQRGAFARRMAERKAREHAAVA